MKRELSLPGASISIWFSAFPPAAAGRLSAAVLRPIPEGRGPIRLWLLPGLAHPLFSWVVSGGQLGDFSWGLQQAGVDCSYVTKVPGPSGCAGIYVVAGEKT